MTIPIEAEATCENHTVHIHKRIKTVEQDNDDDDDDMFDDDIDIEEIDLSAIMASRKPLNRSLSDSFDRIPVDPNDILNTTENSPKPPANSQEKRKKFTRYLVINMTSGSYSVKDEHYSEKVLTLMQEEMNHAITARLRQEWEQTIVVIGDVVHIPHTDTLHDIVIDNQKNFIVVHPDKLISCTAVADSFACLRKSVLQMKIKGASEYSEALIYGNIIHAVLQGALQTGDFSIKAIQQGIENTIMNSLEALYAIDQDQETALSTLSGYADSIHQFGTLYVNEHPKPNAQVSRDMGADVAREMGCTSVAICKVLDIEEHLWSPTYGLKGMVDASVQLKLSPSNKVLTVPFELKTGKASRFLTNRAQTLLYTLLMSDRYDVEIRAGVLYYSKTNSLYLVPALQNDLRSLIMARNYLAVADRKESIPPMIKNMHTCQYCYLNHACTIYHKSIEMGTGNTSELYKLFDDMTDHMGNSTTEFVRHWWKLLDQEEVDIDYVRKDIWSQPAEIREMLGRCLSNMRLNLAASDIDPQFSRWKYCFTRDQALVCNISVGDPVVVSSMDGHINLAMGFVTRINLNEILLSLNEPLRNPPQTGLDFDPDNHQNFNTFIGVRDNVARFYARSSTRYRIDKDEMSTGMALLRNNLIMLVAKAAENEAKCQRLRELIIDLKKPEFKTAAPSMPPLPNMNPDQRNALKRVLQAKDYTLILGMPGTGKTTTTAEIIYQLVKQNKSVLVSAYTHTALDNVLIKVREHGVDILRLGSLDKVMPAMRDCVPSSNSTVTSVSAMHKYYESKKVVGVTCLGIGE
ncbi:DNA replication factor Dna2-domain-containing protein [Gilbertella persicaria]|uniref:DNA replication factor Dna2-domain-containing protein n=1 Tax=Gilbertella persicaria TaxID=101096 RepID=UPI00221E4E07|nr:DNA replication factor Dna2-domain-containing protein [Gilbertella persicaria]KAI8087005.1 DNA replication factor Dna2-domain-containing protein [Gilbertella persicaria]